MEHGGRPGREGRCEERQKAGPERSKPLLKRAVVSFKLSDGSSLQCRPHPPLIRQWKMFC